MALGVKLSSWERVLAAWSAARDLAGELWDFFAAVVVLPAVCGATEPVETLLLFEVEVEVGAETVGRFALLSDATPALSLSIVRTAVRSKSVIATTQSGGGARTLAVS